MKQIERRRKRQERRDFIARRKQVAEAMGWGEGSEKDLLEGLKMLYLGGKSTYEISEDIWVKTRILFSPSAIRRQLKAYGVKVRKQGDAYRLANERGRINRIRKDIL